MGIIEIFLIAVGLGMDSFAVAVCKGLSMKKMNWKKAIVIGLYFGIFQAMMPAIGYLLGKNFESFITAIDHWIAFILLGIIGTNMIKEAFDDDCENINEDVDFKTMCILGIATSIDALAIGITFAFLKVNLWLALIIIGVVAFTLSFFGVKIGNAFGTKYQKRAEILGGIILILMGLKILLEHLGVINF